MTEEEWLRAEGVDPMIEHLRTAVKAARIAAGRRKLRLFACACCRRVWPALPDAASRAAVEAAEAFADRRLTERGFLGVVRDSAGVARALANDCLGHLFNQTPDAADAAGGRGERATQARLLRDVFGDPFRPISLDWSALPPSVASLAEAAYESRDLPSGHLDPARLAVLSDAHEEAGCSDADILSHLRSPGPHVRGCWALDLVLGKG